jgi:SAM-dependent methyltransferase
MSTNYVHGYDQREAQRLQDQAATLTELLHADTYYPPGATVLEAGCGVGAQTLPLLQGSPHIRLTCADISAASLELARAKVEHAGFTANFEVADLRKPPFPEASFDHVFVCFVLEHIAQPGEVLRALRGVLKPGGSLTVIEGDHGSAFFHPDSEYARRAIDCQVALQAMAGGDAHIGRRLHPLLRDAGFSDVRVSPRMVYVDGSRPGLIDGFTRKTFTAMVAGVRDAALAARLSSPEDFERGIAALERAAADDGVFCYTFFKAKCLKAQTATVDVTPPTL